MKALIKVIQFIGMLSWIVGMGCLGNGAIVIPFMMAVMGLGVMYVGAKLDV